MKSNLGPDAFFQTDSLPAYGQVVEFVFLSCRNPHTPQTPKCSNLCQASTSQSEYLRPTDGRRRRSSKVGVGVAVTVAVPAEEAVAVVTYCYRCLNFSAFLLCFAVACFRELGAHRVCNAARGRLRRWSIVTHVERVFSGLVRSLASLEFRGYCSVQKKCR